MTQHPDVLHRKNRCYGVCFIVKNPPQCVLHRKQHVLDRKSYTQDTPSRQLKH
jgi:hypothetical protein